MDELTTLVDTSVLIGAQAGPEPSAGGGWAVSTITIGELETGVLLAADAAVRAHRLALLSRVTERSPVLPVDRAVSTRYGQLRAATGRAPTNDLWIAATALAHDLELLTADRRLAALPLVRSRAVSTG